MEKMCFSPPVRDRSKSQDNVTDEIICANSPECTSPVYKTSICAEKTKIFPNIEDDIPSYQIVRESKRFSDMSEEQESILPLSPVITPPRVRKKENFQVPLVPTIGTIKKNAGVKADFIDIASKESTETCRNAYEILGMMDNDISWNSSMETPVQNALYLEDFNTIERATLLPEKDLKNMQPRVLFSPHGSDDNECVPLRYSSESEEEKDLFLDKLESSKLCEIVSPLKEASDKSNGITETKSNLDCIKSPTSKLTDELYKENTVISPVFRISKKKSRIKKPKTLIVKSPVITTENLSNSSCTNICEKNKQTSQDLSFSAKVPETEMKNNEYFSGESNLIQDDSFQNISFSCIDELCRGLGDVSNSNLTSNTHFPSANNKNNSQINDNKKFNIQKDLSPVREKIICNKNFYYDTGKTDELYPVHSLDDFLKSAKQLEEVNDIPDNKPYENFSDSELIVFNKMISDIPENELSRQGVKRIRPSSSLENSPAICHKKKLMKLQNGKETEKLPKTTEDNEKLVEVNQVINFEESVEGIISAFDINDSQIQLTEICATISDDKNQQVTNHENSLNKETNNDHIENTVVSELDNQNLKQQNNINNVATVPAMFSSALGEPIQISSESYKKALNIFKDEYEEKFKTESDEKENATLKNNFPGFQTASGTALKISKETLNKAKDIFKELDVSSNCLGIDSHETVGFTTASGTRVKISEESLNKAKVLCDLDGTDLRDMKIMQEKSKELKPIRPLGFKTASNKSVEISEESLKRAKELWKEEEESPLDTALQSSEFNSHLSWEKARANAKAPDEACSSTKTESGFCGFSTASGKSVIISENALTKAKKILSTETADSGIREEIMEESPKKTTPETPADPVNAKAITPIEGDHHEGASENSSELIPAWLHAYSTSPTFTLERIHFGAVTSHEDCSRQSTPGERYLIKSPVLGNTDRFFNRKKRKPGKKLVFKSPKQHTLNKDRNKLNFSWNRNPGIKRDLSKLGLDFSVAFKRIKLNDDVTLGKIVKLSFDIIEKRKEARLEQAKTGKKAKVNPVKGSHLLKKKEKQTSWQEAVQGAFPEIYADETLKKYGVRNDVLQITVANAVDYKFAAADFYTSSSCLSNVNGFPVGDGSLLIFDDDNMAGVEEITRAFFASSGVEPNLISPEWVRNHYKWIVWKLGHYERSFPHLFGGKCLTPHNVMVQLKYRYDREIDGSQRPALKKILERDESSTKRMVLCVSDIKKISSLGDTKTESNINTSIVPYELGLSDGWYSCYVQIDSAMSRLIEVGKVTVGTKLITHGAELLNCNDGVSPLEASDKVHLKIFTNSTRRAKWDTKLGFQKNGGPLLISLNSILPNGGFIGRLDVVIVRIYPILYMEKKPDGTHVIRNSRAEDKAASAHQQIQEAIIEKVYQQVKDELQHKAKDKEKLLKKISKSNVSKITDPEELLKLYESSSDPSTFENILTSEQKQILVDYKRRKEDTTNKALSDLVQEKIKTEKMNARKVNQLLKVKIVDLRKSDYANPVLLTVWNSTEDVSQILSEGKAMSIFNTVPSNSRFHKSVQLNSTRYTLYKDLMKPVEYPARKITHLGELSLDCEPIFNEIDIVGIVVFIQETSYGSRLSQTIFMADSEYNFVGLVFWGSCRDLGWENVLTVGSVVACSNLVWGKKTNLNGIPSVYANDSSVFKENPKENYLKEAIKGLKTSLPDDLKNFIHKCEDEITAKLDEQKNSNVTRNTSNPYDSSCSLTSSLKPKYINGFKMKPNASSTPFKSGCFGLDTSDQEPSPIQKRIEKLQMYGEPPPLSPLLPLENLDRFNTKFKAPFKSVVDP